jgi:outer membrane protein assembly factor BamB
VRWRAGVAEVHPGAAVSAGTVLLASETGFVALDRDDGRERWHTDTPETPGPVALAGPGTTPAVAVVSTEPGGLAGLDLRTGAPRWSTRVEGRPRGGLAADGATGTIAGVWEGRASTRLRTFDAATGVVRWEHEIPPAAGTPVVTRVGGRPIVIVGAGDSHYRSAVRAFALDDGSLRWWARVHASFQPGSVPLVDDGAIVVVDQLGTVTALDVTTGARRWSTPTRAATIEAHPVRDRDAILVANARGEVVTLGRRRGAVRARRATAGVPVGISTGRGLVLVAERLGSAPGVHAFRAARLAAPARGAQVGASTKCGDRSDPARCPR